MSEQELQPQQSPEIQQLEPKYRFGSFDILHLAEGTDGITIETREFLKRPSSKALLKEHGLIKEEGEDRRDLVDILKSDVVRAVTQTINSQPPTQEMNLAVKALDDMGMDEDQIKQFLDKLKQAKIEGRVLSSKEEHTAFMNRFAGTNKVSLRNITMSGDRMTADIMKVPYAFYALIGTPEDEAKGLTELANPSATAMIIRTADNKLIVQHRGIKNAQFADMPGASAAGILDDRRNQQLPGSAARLTEGRIEANNLKEAREEVGLSPTNFFGSTRSDITQGIIDFATDKAESETHEARSDLYDVKIAGFAKDNKRIHNEFLLYAKSGRTSSEIVEIAQNAPRPTDQEYDFEEKFFFIDATPEAIETLLCEVKCPLPPTHTAAFLAAGFSMFAEIGRVDEGKDWMDAMELKVKENWEKIDKIVEEYYIKEPERLALNKGADPKGYDPRFVPTAQGLPSLTFELDRTDLEFKV